VGEVAVAVGPTKGRPNSSETHPNEIALFARRNDQLRVMRGVLRAAQLPCMKLGEGDEDRPAETSGITLATMHRAKGLEYKAVFVVDVSDDSIPEGKSYRQVTDPTERNEALQRERQLLYVSVTRARDDLFLSWVGEASRFLGGVL